MACHFPRMLGRTGHPRKRLGIIEPCMPTRVSKPAVGPQWIHEIKHNGYRLIAR
jgi:ATP-dependent DNA ligase